MLGLMLQGCDALPKPAFLQQTVACDTPSANSTDNCATGSAGQQELAALLAQPYIDPLTDYLQRHQNDTQAAEHIKRIRQEREMRCAVVAKRFNAQEVTEASVSRFREGYAYSCPQQVDNYAAQLPPAPAPVQTIDSAETEQLESPQHDCYLLTAIKNYHEALTACQQPAQDGDTQSQTNLALIYHALERYDEAQQWALAAAKESAEARFLLGEMYTHGEGFAADPQKAQYWYQAADQLGHPLAAAQLYGR